jgi:hypothetical protein
MAGPTTQANSAIGPVTEAQMAKILINEYCFELAGTWGCTASDWVFVMALSLVRKGVFDIGRGARDRPASYAARLMVMSTCGVMCSGRRGRTVFAWW